LVSAIEPFLMWLGPAVPCLNGDPVLDGTTDPKLDDFIIDLYITMDAAV